MYKHITRYRYIRNPKPQRGRVRERRKRRKKKRKEEPRDPWHASPNKPTEHQWTKCHESEWPGEGGPRNEQEKPQSGGKNEK
jgi:hypothetical protein